jgi:hypothetical protein
MGLGVFFALSGAIVGLRCRVAILLIALVPAVTVIAVAGALQGHGLELVMISVAISSVALQAGYLAGVLARRVYVGFRSAPIAARSIS